MIAPIVYILCFSTSLLCTVLLLKSYFKLGNKLLLWTGLCFLGLSVNNLFLILDLWLLPDVNLLMFRASFGLIGLLVLIYGLVREATL